MTIETCAKVNLTLEVLRRREDGFHELATVFQAIDLTDRLTFRRADSLSLEVRGVPVPSDSRNLVHRAATLLARTYGIEPAVHIRIDKRIPVGAGLGGGSGNAAGALAGLARFWDLPTSDDELAGLAATLGSDCAFFIRGGAAVGRGRGELLEPLPTLTGYSLLLLGPRESVSTPAVYRALQGFRPDAGAATELLAAGLRSGAVPPPSAWLVNDLAEPAARVSARVAEDAEILAREAPGCAMLSGSGGAWFLVTEPERAEALRLELATIWPTRPMWLVRPVAWGQRVL